MVLFADICWIITHTPFPLSTRKKMKNVASFNFLNPSAIAMVFLPFIDSIVHGKNVELPYKPEHSKNSIEKRL